MKTTLKFKKSFVYMTLISYITSPLMMTFSPVVMALQTNSTSEGSNAEQLVANELVNKGAKSFENWLGQFGTSKIQLNLDEDFNFSDSSFDTLLAIQDTEPLLTFTQFGARYKDDRVTLNMGLGQRHFIDENMLGYNAFYDYEADNAHSRIGLGLEYATNFFRATSNGYIGVSGWEASEKNADTSEKVADGIDLRLEGYLPQFPQMGASARYEKYFGQDVTLFSDDDKQNDPSAIAIGLNYTPVPLITIGAEHKMGENGLDESSVNLAFNFALGKSLESQIDPDEVKNQRSLIGSRYDLVNRNNLIVVERKSNKVSISLPPMISGKEGQIIPLDISNSDGIVRYEWDADEFFAAGGKITKVDGVWEFTLPDYIEGQNNQYTVGLVVIDNKGQRSSPKNTTITVNKKEELNLGSKDGSLEVTVAEPTVNGAQTLVKIPIVDENGKAVINQAVELTITDPDGKISTMTVLTDEKGVASHSFMQTKAGETLIEARFGGRKFSKTVVYKPVAINPTPSFKDSVVSITSGNGFMLSDSVEAVASIPVVDEKGNPLAGVEVEFTVTDVNGKSTVTTAITDANGIASLPISQKQAGDVSVSAKVGSSTATGSATIRQTPAVPSFKDSTVKIQSGNGFMSSDSVEAVASIPVVDENGKSLAGVEVEFTVTDVNGTSTVTTAITDANGIASLPISQKQAGDVSVSAKVGSSTATGSATITKTPAVPSFKDSAVKIQSGNGFMSSDSVEAVASIPVVDEKGNALVGVEVEFTVTDVNGISTVTTAITDANGIASLPISQKQAGDVSVSAKVGSSTATGSATITKTPAVPSFKDSAVKIQSGNGFMSSDSVEAVASIPVVDEKGNALVGVEVEFTVTDVNGISTVTTAITDANGIASLPISQKQAGDVNVSAKVGSSTATGSATITQTPAVPSFKDSTVKIQSGNGFMSSDSVEAVASIPVVDEKGNALVGVEVEFTVTDVNGISTVTTAITDANGIASLPISQKQAGDVSVSAKVGSSTATGSATITKTPAVPSFKDSAVKIQSGNGFMSSDSVEAVASIPVVDEKGNALVGVEVEFTVTDVNGISTVITAITDANGIASLPISQKQAGDVNVSAKVGSSTATGSATIIQTPAVPSFKDGAVKIQSGNGFMSSDSVEAVASIPVVDEKGNPLAGVEVEFTVTDVNGKSTVTTAITDAAGIASLPISQKQAGNVNVSAKVGSSTATGSATITQTPAVPSFKDSTVKIQSGNDFVSSDSVEAVASIPVVDEKGNALAGVEVEFTVTDVNGKSTVTTAITDAAGIARLPISQKQAGNVNVSAKVGSSTATGSATIKPIVPAVKDGQINVTSENGFIVTDAETNKVIVPIVDQNGNVLSNVDVTINVTGPDGLVIEKIVKTDEFGNAILPFAQIKAGETVITATVNGTAITKNVTFIADKASAVIDENGLVVTKNGAVADLIDVNTVQVTIKDKFGNLVSDMPIEFSSAQELNLGGKATSNIIMTNTDGVAITNLTTTKAQIFTVNASVNGLTATKDVNFIVGAPDASKSLLTAVPSTIKTLPGNVTTLTLALKDKYENPINGKTVAFNTIVPAGDFSMGSVTAKQDGTYVVQYSVNRTRTSDFSNIVTPISVTVNGQAFSIAPQNITVQREYYEVPVGEIVDNQPLTASQVTALLDKYESVRLFMTNGRYATTITLPASAKKGAALEVTSNTDLTTVLSGNGIAPVFIDKKQITLIRFIFDGTKWNEITRS